jgi:putative transcriptional regulator
VGNRIAALRKSKHLTQAELAKLVGISRPYLSDIETGKYKNPGSLVLLRLAKALDAKVEDIFFEHSVNHAEQMQPTGTDNN